MKKQGTAQLVAVHFPYGSAYTLTCDSTQHVYALESADFIIPESVRLDFYGEPLIPTQYDSHGNPQISGIADRILAYKLRQKVRDSVINSIYSGMVSYFYETTDGHPIAIPFEKRRPRIDLCPACGKPITTYDLDHSDEITDEDNGMISAHWEPKVEKLSNSDALVHRNCAKTFYRLQMIDEITECVGLAFNSYSYDEANRFHWGKGEHDMHYELIPNEYCSRSCCTHRPWFMFHTPIGDIKIGWRKRVISITFMPNFAPFDMTIFAGEDVTKGTDQDNTRYIHADGEDNLYKYLVLVHKAVLPNSKK